MIILMLGCLAAQWSLDARAAPVASETGAVPCLTQAGHVLPFNPRSSRIKRYNRDWSKWDKKSLTYNISKYPSRLDGADVDGEIARAFAEWSNYTDLSFSPNSEEVDIEIRFERGEHGDEDPFDGRRGKVLAHAFYPWSGGAVHFDDDENWTVGSYRGVSLFQTALHELGHSLGLRHSQVKSSVMYRDPKPYNPRFKLTSDDIAGIQAIYGPKTREVPQESENRRLDAIVTS